ncbi:NAD-dependent protein deacetylase sirtuin-7-like [Sycon ciliatum]|uniref:NAD-dependent protein deacetylase sirtuin-7-like n=1 Tax=Sycon ciliatum TaxID=27933 RepID=UPI0031F67C23
MASLSTELPLKVEDERESSEAIPLSSDSSVCELVDILRCAPHVVVYTGAGISTAAAIPDYRGPNGVYTLAAKGQAVSPCDLTAANPTLTHMVLVALLKTGRVKHIVSQNCDGLHRRSGVVQEQISEIHGNMYIEVCKQCSPPTQYIRECDVTGKTARHRHATGRACSACYGPLHDTIVLPGERGSLAWPLNWAAALEHAHSASHILVLGSSLKVLRHYKDLWMMARAKEKRPKVLIINQQATSKDKQAMFRIERSCDEVMGHIALQLALNVPHYDRIADPFFNAAIDILGPNITTIKPAISCETCTGLCTCATSHSTPATSVVKQPPRNWYSTAANKRSYAARTFGKRRRKSKRSAP